MTNYKATDLKTSQSIGLARLQAVGQMTQAKFFSMRLETRAGIKPL